MSAPGNRQDWLGFIVAVSRGIIRDQKMRRNVLFIVVLLALLMVAVGSVLLDVWLTSHVLLFLLYWGTCTWLTLLAVLMALFDILVVRQEALRERQRIKRDMLEGNGKDAPDKK